MRVIGRTKPKGAMRVKASSTQAEGRSLRGAGSGLACPIAGGEYLEHTCWDPKDGELCLARMKWEEALGGKSFSVALFGFGIQSGQDLVPWPRPGLLPPALRCREAL